MNEIKITREKLIKAFAKWKEDFKVNPDEYYESTDDFAAEESADHLIELLEGIDI